MNASYHFSGTMAQGSLEARESPGRITELGVVHPLNLVASALIIISRLVLKRMLK